MLHALAGKSLVQAETIPRVANHDSFYLLESIFEYASKQLRAQYGELIEFLAL